MATKQDILNKLKNNKIATPSKEEILNKVKNGVVTNTPVENKEQPPSIDFTAEDAKRRLAVKQDKDARKQEMQNAYVSNEMDKVLKGAELVRGAENIMKAQQQRLLKGTDNLTDYAKTLAPEKIEELKGTSPILNPEKYHKDVDAGYYGRKAAEGFARAGEGISDAMTRLREHVEYPALKAGEFITSLGGTTTNRASETFASMIERNKQKSEDVMKETPVENYAKMTDYIYNNAGKGHKLLGDVVSGVTAMAPTIAANFVLPGSGYAVLGAQGYGSGVQQAYQHTGELGAKEDIYGLLSGLVEVGVEKLSGGIGGLGNGVVDDIAAKLIKNGFIRSATGEGIEEAVTTFIDPYLQRLTYNKGAEGAKLSEILRSALVGTLTSMLLQGGSAAISSVNTSLNTDKSVKKLNKIDNKTLNQLEDIKKNLGKGITYSEVANLPDLDKKTQKQLSEIEKLIPGYKTDVQEQATNDLKQPMQQANQVERETVQNGNVEQMAKNIENNNILEYNNNRGVENGEERNVERYTSEVRNGVHQESAQENRQYNKSEYEQWEQSLKPIPRERLTTEEITDIDNTQKEYGKTVNLIDENENSNKYSGGASLIKKGQLNISKQQAEYFGLKNMIEHEVVEDDILYNDTANDILTPAIELIMKDTKFDDQKKAFWSGETSNMPTDALIAKDLLCDRFAEIKNNTKMKYNNVLSPEVNTNIDMALQNYYKQVYGKELNTSNTQADKQSAFSMPENKQRINKENNSTGEILADENYVYKNTKAGDRDTNEFKIYSMLKGNSNILQAELENGKIKTPRAKYILSKDDMNSTQAHKASNIVSNQKDNIIQSIIDITNKGINYNDELQYAYVDGKLKLFDFSNSEINSEYAMDDNYSSLVRYLHYFGLDSLANRIDKAMYLRGLAETYRKEAENDWLLPDEQTKNELREILKNSDVEPNNVYFSKNKRFIQGKERVSQVTTDEGTFVYSTDLLNDKFLNEWELEKIYTKESNKGTFFMQNNFISPVQDIQKASEFIKKATVEDIDTLNKMVEEAEKYPDRIDLQFFAEKAREVIEKLSRQQVRQAIMEETGVENYNLDDVNKISKAKMNFTTPVRVIEKIFNKETANKINENFFKPIKHNEAERIRRLNKERADIKELDIKPGSAEDAAIQKYGEGEYVDTNGFTMPYTLENLKRDFPETWQKLQNATNVIRNKYDTYLEEINEVLQDNGYDPIPKRKDYFRHFEELNDLFSVLGVPTKLDDIPTDLNGMTADLKPGKHFFANALQRNGKKTTYSAIKGIDGYLDGAMNILYHTKDIQKLRTLDKYIRDTYGQAKGLANVDAMTDGQKSKRISQINEGHLSEFAAWLTEYANALAGKKSRLDRGMEEMFGRRIYKTLNLIKKQVGANMTGLNINTALSNFISVMQAAPKTNKKALLKGTIDTVKNIFNNDGFIDKSDFLTTRFGSDKLAKNWWQKAGDVGQIFMSGTDYFTANLIVRSKYQEYLNKGYTQEQAIKKADEFADRLMAGRGKGDLPNAFESKMLGIVTQFQLEVTNQLDSIFYDTLHEDYAAESKSKLAKEHPNFYNAASATFILGQIFALAFLYNEGKEKFTGTEGGALDPIGTVLDAFKYYTDNDLEFWEATAKVVEDIANQLPFLSIVTGGGRIPIKEAFPDLLSVMKGESKLGDELWNLTNLALPTGGGQIKKTMQGLDTFIKGGSYGTDNQGRKKLKYPVKRDIGNAIKSVLFGKYSTEYAQDYIDNDFKTLSAKQTESFEKAKKQGISYDVFMDVYNAQKNIESDKDAKGDTIPLSSSKNKKNAIDELIPGYSKKQKQTLYEAFGISEKVWNK